MLINQTEWSAIPTPLPKSFLIVLHLILHFDLSFAFFFLLLIKGNVRGIKYSKHKCLMFVYTWSGPSFFLDLMGLWGLHIMRRVLKSVSAFSVTTEVDRPDVTLFGCQDYTYLFSGF